MAIPEQVAAQLKQMSEKAFPFVERTGLTVDAIDTGYCRISMPLEGNHNHIGTMYAGALFTLAELPGGIIYLTLFDTSRFFPILKNLDIHFKKPATGTIHTTAELSKSEAERISHDAEANGKCDFSWQLELKNEAEETVAVADCLYQLRKN